LEVYINWRDVQRKNVVHNVDMSSSRASWLNGPFKNKHKEQHKNTQNIQTQQTCRKKLFFGFFILIIFIYNFLNDFLQEMLSYRLGKVNYFHWEFKLVFRYCKPHTYSTFFGEEYENKIHLLSLNLGNSSMNKYILKMWRWKRES